MYTALISPIVQSNQFLLYLALLVVSTLLAGCMGENVQAMGGNANLGRAEQRAHRQAPPPQNTGQLPQVPPPDASAAKVPPGFRVEVVLKNLTYPTSVEFDDQGNMFVAEAGYSYGDESARPRLSRVSPQGDIRVLTQELEGPINDLLWHQGRLYISHRGRISAWQDNRVRDLVTGLPSKGDHHNNQMSVGPDGKIYFGQGTASNSGVIGVDNYKMGWLNNHPQFHDIPARDVRLRGKQFLSENPLRSGDQQVRTAAFHPFGELAPVSDLVKGQTKAGGTILRMNPDGSGLEVYAWGLRNPFGVVWTPEGKLYASENGFDVRGSRPIANDKEDLYEIKQNAWYGWPDFASGIPVTNPRFKPENGPQPQFLMQEHPPVEKPIMTFPKHSATTKLAVSPGGAFGQGQLYLAFFGHMAPMTGKVEEHGGHRVVRIDLAANTADTFFGKGDHHGGQGGAGQGGGTQQGAGQSQDAPRVQSSQHQHGGKSENQGSAPSGSSAPGDHSGQSSGHHGHSGKEESISAGPRRLMDVVFSRNGDALYVVDFGSMLVKDKPMPIPHTGVIWRVTPEGQAAENTPPVNLSAPGQ